MREELPKHGLWFFGVILGLAIKEALTHVLPHALNPSFTDSRALSAEALRLVLFLALSIRFYLGAVKYFQEAYKAQSDSPNKGFGPDFLFGFVHFIFFLFCALAIDVHDIPKHWFPILLLVILLYDLAWFTLSKGARKFIKVWTTVNVATALVAALAYVVTRELTRDPMTAEQVAYVPVFIVTFIDMIELTEGKRIFSQWFKRLGDE